MMSAEQARELWANSEEIVSAQAVQDSLDRMAAEITAKMGDTFPLVLSVMGGAVVFTGMLLPKLAFPLEFDYIHLSRYNNKTVGGEMQWRVAPRESVKDRTVLVLDDILGWADPRRLAAIGPVLAEAAGTSQVLLFTCSPERFASVSPARVIHLPGGQCSERMAPAVPGETEPAAAKPRPQPAGGARPSAPQGAFDLFETRSE